MAFKLLISGESNAGKTTLTQGMKNSLVISHDGKAYPYANPHAILKDITTADDITNFVNDKVLAYKERYKVMPETLVFDSVSRIFQSLHTSAAARFSGFKEYAELDKQVSGFAELLEDIVSSGINVVIISHALYNTETAKYELVGKGSFNKMGGFLSVVDESIFLTVKNDKRVLYFRSVRYPSRTLNEDTPDFMDAKDFNLTDHIEALTDRSAAAAEFAL